MILEIKFLMYKTIYQYNEVPEDIWYALRKAESVDIYFNSNIIGNYLQIKKIN